MILLREGGLPFNITHISLFSSFFLVRQVFGWMAESIPFSLKNSWFSPSSQPSSVATMLTGTPCSNSSSMRVGKTRPSYAEPRLCLMSCGGDQATLSVPIHILALQHDLDLLHGGSSLASAHLILPRIISVAQLARQDSLIQDGMLGGIRGTSPRL